MAPRRIRIDTGLKGGAGVSSAAIGSLGIDEVSRPFLEHAFGAEENTLENATTVYLSLENKSHNRALRLDAGDAVRFCRSLDEQDLMLGRADEPQATFGFVPTCNLVSRGETTKPIKTRERATSRYITITTPGATSTALILASKPPGSASRCAMSARLGERPLPLSF
jgi:hypothetical protein